MAIATVELLDGRLLTVSCDTSLPERDLALRRDHVTRKFTSLVAPVLGSTAANAMRDAILSLEHLDSLSPLLALAIPQEHRTEMTATQ